MLHLDFPAKYMDELNQIIRKYLPDAEIWAFGSRVTRQNHEASDLDLVVHNQQPSEALASFKEAVLNSNIPVLIDILDWENIPDAFKKEIQTQYIILHNPEQKK